MSLNYDLDFAYSFELVFCYKLHDYILIEIIMRDKSYNIFGHALFLGFALFLVLNLI
jgi:hypothetical protein